MAIRNSITVKELREMINYLKDDTEVIVDMSCVSYDFRLNHHKASVSSIGSLTEKGLVLHIEELPAEFQ